LDDIYIKNGGDLAAILKRAELLDAIYIKKRHGLKRIYGWQNINKNIYIKKFLFSPYIGMLTRYK
jgi:hypothetical protein